MVFLIAASIGVCAAMMRSAFSLAFIACLLVATFAFASAISAGPVSYMNLLVAILGYNVGLINFIAGLMVVNRLRAA